MNKILKSILINKITKLTKKLAIVKVTNKCKTKKRNRNNIKTAHRKNTLDMKVKQK